MTGEQIFFKYQESGPVDYASLLMTIYQSIGEAIFPLLAKADAANKKLAVTPKPVDDHIGDITVDDVAFI